MQQNLFQDLPINPPPLPLLDIQSIKGSTLDRNEAPQGFYAVDKKEAKTPNVCNSCDAKSLCQKNENDWCLKNRCMSYEMVAFKDGKTYKRNDGRCVIFKQVI
jgi:hypothetical protein